MKYKNLLIFAIIIAVFTACGNSESGKLSDQENLGKDASYALGMSIGGDLKKSMIGGNVYPNLDEFITGLRDVLTDRKTRLNEDELAEILNQAFDALEEKKNAEAEQTEKTFMAENAAKPGIKITSSGLQYEVITEGNGPKPQATDKVLVNYNATFTNGDVFDSSYERGAPQSMNLSEVIPGWTEGLQLMSTGSHYIFYIPSALGYGERGFQNPWTGEIVIPPYSPLIFTVELLEINPETGDE